MTRALAAMLTATTLLACGGGGGAGVTPSLPPTPTALQVAVSITRTVSEPDQTTVIDWTVGVRNNGVGVNTAIVTIAGLSVPRRIGFIDGDYWLGYEKNPVNTAGTATYVPGQDYTVTVDVGGTVYTDTLRVPGGITVDATGSNVSWVQGGNIASILVTHLFGATTYTTASLGTNLSSPQAIPATAYPSADTYQITTMVQNKKLPAGAYPGVGYFSTLVGPDTYFYIQDGHLKRVTR